MRTYALIALVVAGCGSGGSTTVTTTSAPPADMGSGGGGGNGGGTAGGGAGGMPGGGGGVDGGMSGGSGGGGVDGGSGGGTACSDTQPVAITRAGSAAFSVAADDDDVYFTAAGPGSAVRSVWRAPRSGGAAVEVAHPDDSVGELTVNATAFFTNSGRILRWPKGGGAPTVLHQADVHYGTSCLTDALGYIYFCSVEADHNSYERVPEDGGAEQAVANTLGPAYLAFDPQHAWFTGNGGVTGTAPDGSGASIYIRGLLGPIGVDDAHVFCATDGVLRVADKQDGATPRDLGPTLADGHKLRVYGGSVYVLSSDFYDGTPPRSQLARFAADGSSSAVLVERSGGIEDFAVRDAYVYFTVENNGAVYRACR